MRLLNIKEIQEMQLTLMKDLHVFLENNNITYYLIAGSALGAVRHNGFIPWDDDIDIGIFRDDYEKFIEIANNFNDIYEIKNFKNSSDCDYCLTRIYFKNTYIDNPYIRDTELDKRLYFDVFPLDNVPDDEFERENFERIIKRKLNILARVDARNYGDGNLKLIIKRIISKILVMFRGKLLRNCDCLMKKYRHNDTAYICSICSQYSFKKQAMPKAYYGRPTLHKFEDAEFYIPEQADCYLTHLYGENYMEVPPLSKRRKGHNIYSTIER